MINATTNKSILEDTDVQRALSIVYSDGYNRALKEVKEYLEKRLSYATNIYERSDCDDYNGGYMDAISEIIKELFKEEQIC